MLAVVAYEIDEAGFADWFHGRVRLL